MKLQSVTSTSYAKIYENCNVWSIVDNILWWRIRSLILVKLGRFANKMKWKHVIYIPQAHSWQAETCQWQWDWNLLQTKWAPLQPPQSPQLLFPQHRNVRITSPTLGILLHYPPQALSACFCRKWDAHCSCSCYCCCYILSFCSIEIAEALTPIYCVFIPDNIGFIRNRHRSIEKKAITNGT